MQNQTVQQAREVLAQAVSRYHMADRRLRLHHQAWRAMSGSLTETIERFWAAERQIPNPEWIPQDLRKEGEFALNLCAQANDRKDRLMQYRHQQLREAFLALGAYYGALMAADVVGSLLARFSRHLEAALQERERNIDRVRVKLTSLMDLESFDLMVSWAKAMGYKTPKAFLSDLLLELEMRQGKRAADMNEAIRLGIVSS
ncbi:hypothetical protein [Cupriavidus sp. TMH.W2]|uniref:hypothetical protein n=1 Tax=Cupriavidus sp. TMH.W2 TaxID=3434465 RepID=UPI003D77E085